ncbi:MAG: hypothetical protein EHM41_03075 [Chloroflexi bacterium]|nr:MAG: hypothetical protein EHM41_03075 [Chloroflexota bacterium]
MKKRYSILNRLRFLNKMIFNRVTLKFAGSSLCPISIIQHIGRLSGTQYATPIIVIPFAEKFIFALPYGDKVDWYRNVRAAGRGIVVWHGKQYLVEDPELFVVSTGEVGFPLILRLIVPFVSAQLFRQMKFTRVIDKFLPEHQKGMAF